MGTVRRPSGTLGNSHSTKGSPVPVESREEGITYPPLDELLEKTDSKYSLVIEAARRARQINTYYSQLSEGALEHVGPLVETYQHEKPLSIALREVVNDMIDVNEPSDEPEVVGLEVEDAFGTPVGADNPFDGA